MREQASKLPDWPRGLSADLAAAYVGLSESYFRSLVKSGEIPAPVHLPGRRVVWLREVLDGWLDRRAGVAPALAEADEWAG